MNKKCNHLGTEVQKTELDKCLVQYNKKAFSNIKLLETIQAIYGYLPESILKYTSSITKISESELYSTASFYKQFSFNPKGKYVISVCLGTACYVNGSNLLLDKISSVLGIKAGECTKDNMFSIDETRCLGCCGMAPVIMINDEVYGNVKLSDVEKLIMQLKEK